MCITQFPLPASSLQVNPKVCVYSFQSPTYFSNTAEMHVLIPKAIQMVPSKLLCGLTDLLASIVLHISAKNCCLAIEQLGQLTKFA